jgi:outer membrane lipoprotein LolB
MIIGSLLAGCTSLPPAAMPARQQVDNFSIEARFALRVSPPGQAPQRSGGRLSWTHKDGDNQLLISNPLGYGLAEIDTTPKLSRLRTADGQSRESTDPDALLEEVTGQRLPVTRLAAWLLGRASETAEIVNDEQQRPSQLREAGWQVDYIYPDEATNALPARLTLSRDPDIELLLRIEEWIANP